MGFQKDSLHYLFRICNPGCTVWKWSACLEYSGGISPNRSQGICFLRLFTRAIISGSCSWYEDIENCEQRGARLMMNDDVSSFFASFHEAYLQDSLSCWVQSLLHEIASFIVMSVYWLYVFPSGGGLANPSTSSPIWPSNFPLQFSSFGSQMYRSTVTSSSEPLCCTK